MKKYLINGKEIEEMKDLHTSGQGIISAKINQILEALDQTPKEWTPDDLEDGDEYWFVDNDGEIFRDDWQNAYVDIFRKKTKNIFPTKKQAEARLKEIMES